MPRAIVSQPPPAPHRWNGERVAEHFDLPVMGAAYERVYQRVLDRSSRTRRAAQAVA